MNDHLLQLPLGGGPLHNLLIDGVCCDQAEHQHRLGLANPVAAVLGLQVCLRILGENKQKKKKRPYSTRVGNVTLSVQKAFPRLIHTYPVTVEDDDCISSGQVDAQASCSCTQKEQEHLGIISELLHLQTHTQNQHHTVTVLCKC